MTSQENERLARIETRQDAMSEDVGEIKTMVSQLVASQQASADSAHKRHADIEARLKVLEKDSSRYERFLWGAGGLGAGSTGLHVLNYLQGGFGG